MFDVELYLRRIGCGGETGVSVETLRKLQKRHLMAIPYSSVAYALPDAARIVGLDEDSVFETSILKGNGGACYHLNRLFYRLLSELGYDVTIMAGSTIEGRVNFTTAVEHMFLCVALDGGQWLVDVGYPGPSYVEPLLVSDAVQSQRGSQFRLVDHESELVLRRRGLATRWSTVYSFTMRARQWSDWSELEADLRQILSDPVYNDAPQILCGRTFEDEQVFMRQRRYLTVRNGREHARTIVTDDEHRMLLSRVLSGTAFPRS